MTYSRSCVYYLPDFYQHPLRHVLLGELVELAPGRVGFRQALGRVALTLPQAHQSAILLVLSDLDDWRSIDSLPASAGPHVVISAGPAVRLARVEYELSLLRDAVHYIATAMEAPVDSGPGYEAYDAGCRTASGFSRMLRAALRGFSAVADGDKPSKLCGWCQLDTWCGRANCSEQSGDRPDSASDSELLARIRGHGDRDALVRALEMERDLWRSLDDGPGADGGDLFEDLLALLRGEGRP